MPVVHSLGSAQQHQWLQHQYKKRLNGEHPCNRSDSSLCFQPQHAGV